jgi:hypothetical protein
MLHRSRRPALVLCTLLAGACYEYVPARSVSSLLGQHVQLSLTDSGSVAMASRVGPSVEAIEGNLLADSAGAYVLGVTLTRARSGAETDWREERVAVPHALVASFAERRFSRSRSTFAGALMSAGVVALTVGLRGGGGSSGGGGPIGGRPVGQ